MTEVDRQKLERVLHLYAIEVACSECPIRNECRADGSVKNCSTQIMVWLTDQGGKK